MTAEPSFRDPIPRTCDFLVVGAGPAGLVAAHRLLSAKAGSVVLIDRRDPWREPVACAEGVEVESLRRASPLPVDSWIRGPIHQCKFTTGNTSFVWRYPESGAIVDRVRMHRDLALDVARLGGICHFRCGATELSGLSDGFRTLGYEGETTGAIKARCVIDASGPGAGLAPTEPLRHGSVDLETAAFAFLDGPDHDLETIELWLSQEFAPGGYGWIFPSGPNRANVGVVCGRGARISSREGLLRFLRHLRPDAPIPRILGGAIPCAKDPRPLARELLFKAGDAASMVHPLSRAGITQAMESGLHAAVAARLALPEPDERHRAVHYRAYEKTYRQGWGREHKWVALAKPWIARIDDRVWDVLFTRLSAFPPDKHSWPRIFALAARVVPLALRTLRPKA